MSAAKEDKPYAASWISRLILLSFTGLAAYLIFPLLPVSLESKPTTMLFSAVDSSNFEGVRKALVAGADVNAQNSYGFTPLNNASAKGNLDLIRLLIDNGANISMTDGRGWTPLHEAAFQGQLHVAEYFIGKGVDINARSVKEVKACTGASYPPGITAKKVATIAGRREMITLIARNGGVE
jgi:ankyrin repeat protein